MNWTATCHCGETLRFSALGPGCIRGEIHGLLVDLYCPNGRTTIREDIYCSQNAREGGLATGLILFEQKNAPPPTLPALQDITLGCDPEFVGYLDGKRINFEYVLPGFDGQLGYDHGGRVAELRPPPAKFARTIIKRLRAIMQGAPAAARVASWKGGAVASNPDTALGGHIHLGVDYQTWRHALVPALDALTTQLFKLDILPDQDNKGRERLGYGQMGDTRTAMRGTNSVLEYRSMCSWLFDPKVAMLALTGAKLAAADPNFATETLKGPASHRKLHAFFEKWRDNLDAKYCCEQILSGKPPVATPDRDIQEAWELDDVPSESLKTGRQVAERAMNFPRHNRVGMTAEAELPAVVPPWAR